MLERFYRECLGCHLHCILDFERSGNQKQGSEFFSESRFLLGGLPLPSSPMAFIL